MDRSNERRGFTREGALLCESGKRGSGRHHAPVKTSLGSEDSSPEFLPHSSVPPFHRVATSLDPRASPPTRQYTHSRFITLRTATVLETVAI